MTAGHAGDNSPPPNTMVEQLAGFVASTGYDQISGIAQEQLKVRILDALGCATGALDGEPVRMVRDQVDDFGAPATAH